MIKSLNLQISYWWNHRPLMLIMAIAILLRAFGVIFSKGYGMHDDHFLIIEVAQKWLEGIPYWFDRGEPSLHSLIYPGFHYLLFYFLETIGITDPQAKMYIVRFLHGLYSLLIPYYGYKLALLLSDKKTARNVGIILAAMWCLPYLSVRNLREITCIPPLLMGFYYLEMAKDPRKFKKHLILAGMLFGLAFTFRYQTIFFSVGLGLVLLIKRQWSQIFYFTLSFLLFVTFTQGVIDFIAWGYPFASLHAYYIYNTAHSNDFITAPWYQHLLTILAYLGPPACLIFIWGYLKSWLKNPELFWGMTLFLVFHSIFPNKQERFIFPLIPFFVVIGLVGWTEFTKKSVFWRMHPKFQRGIWIYFWIINLIVLPVYTITYGKRSRVEAMYYLGKQPDFKYALLETYRDRVAFPPLFYLDKWDDPYELDARTSIRKLRRNIRVNGNKQPNYVVFFGDKDIDKRMNRVKELFPNLLYQTTIDNSLVDEITFKLNPRFQANETGYIYKIVLK